MKIKHLLVSLAMPLSAIAQTTAVESETELGNRLAHCTGVFSMVQAAPESLKLAVSKSDASSLGQISMLQTFVLLGPAQGDGEVKTRLAALKNRLDSSLSNGLFSEVLEAEARTCSLLALENFSRLKSRITNLLETQRR